MSGSIFSSNGRAALYPSRRKTRSFRAGIYKALTADPSGCKSFLDIEGEPRTELMPIGNSESESPESKFFPLAPARPGLGVGTEAGSPVDVMNPTFVTGRGLSPGVRGIERRLRGSPPFTAGGM